MKAPVRVLQYILVSLVIVAALIYAAAVSSVEDISDFRCTGTLKGEPRIVYVRMKIYRWYAGLWHGTDGSLQVEVPNEYSYRRSNIKNYGDSIAVCWSDGSVCGLLGFYSKLTSEIRLNSLKGSFSGTCNKISRGKRN